MTAEDLPAVMEIAGVSLDSPWSSGQLSAELLSGGLQLVTETAAGVAAYVFFRHCGDEAELMQIAVAPRSRRRGLAASLLHHAWGQLGSLGVGRCFLEVRQSNTAARRLYAACGFRPVGHRRAYYQTPLEDAVVMEKRIGSIPGEEVNDALNS